MTTPWFEYLAQVTPYPTRGGQPAPHQPALMLAWIGHRFATGQPDLNFAEAEAILKRALPELSKSKGVAGKTNMPFTALMRSGFWESNVSPDDLDKYPSGDFAVTALRDYGATIRPGPALLGWLEQDPGARAPVIVRAVLEAFFPPRVWQHVLDSVDVPVACAPAPTPLAAAYEMRYEDLRELRRDLWQQHRACQACGMSVPGILEVAHPHWLVCGGSPDASNAWLLCRTDAAAIDLGRLGLDETGWVSDPADGLRPTRPAPEPTAAAAWHHDHVLRVGA